MKAPDSGRVSSLPYLTAVLAVLAFGCCIARADKTKPAPQSTSAKAPAAAKSAAPAAAAGKASTTTSHGPATGSKGLTTTSKGPTTTSKGPTTASRGPTTTNKGPTTTTKTTTPTTRTTPTTKTPTTGPNASTGPGKTGGLPAARTLPKGSREVHNPRGDSLTRRRDGRVADVHDSRRGMDIHHGLNGGRRVEVRRGDRRIVVERRGRGFVERPYRFHGREYAHRTFYYHGRAYDHFYHGYYYHGAFVEMYTPVVYYRPAFYGWAYNPWGPPVAYGWAWVGSPWYGYYGAYFAPYPVYPSAAFWLTDYTISTTLAAAYEERMADDQAQAVAQTQTPPDGEVDLSPQVKEQIAAEVQRQIAIENAESATASQDSAPNPAMSGVQEMFNDNAQHIFVAGHSIDVVDASGAECSISEGDALKLTAPPSANATTANLVMLSSRGGKDCRVPATVAVEVADLQEMQNHMRETIDQGMNELYAKQGQGGLPSLPASAASAPTKAAFAAEAPGPDATAAADIAQESQEADKAEGEVAAEVPADSGSGPSAGSVAPVPFAPMGKTADEITAQFGQPKNIVDLGSKKIFTYSNMKVTFKDGKVVDVQ